MTNVVLASKWSERIWRLRLGIAPRDALGRPGPISGLGLHAEDVPGPWPLPKASGGEIDVGVGLPGMPQSRSGRFAIRFGANTANDRLRIGVRIVDRERRYVPRRFSIPAPTFEAVDAADKANALDPSLPLVARAFRPVLYPGAAYGVGAGATAIRGRVLWESDSTPVAWPRVVARTAASITVVDDDGNESTIQPILGRAHGDDRGEFLLILGSIPTGLQLGLEDSTMSIDVSVRVNARPFPEPDVLVESPTESRDDPLWHLPVEWVSSLMPSDSVAEGTTTPSGYTATVTQVVTCRFGAPTRPAVTFFVPGP